MKSNKIKALFIIKGYSMKSVAKLINHDYQSLRRKVLSDTLQIREVELIADKLNLTAFEVIEFFLPNVFQKLKLEGLIKESCSNQ
jgi:hypothetical protein